MVEIFMEVDMELCIVKVEMNYLVVNKEVVLAQSSPTLVRILDV